jgi:energy-converting hydrogenase A subunit M
MDAATTADFYDKVNKENTEDLQSFFNVFVEKRDYASMHALMLKFEAVKRSLYIRDMFRAHIQVESD